jgi:hypothetical protein
MKIAVYTCTTGGYDRLEEIDNPYDHVACICFTDNRAFTSHTWQVRYIDDLGPENRDKIKTARHYKILAHRYLSDYDASVWIDGNMFDVHLDNIVKDCEALLDDTVDMYITDHCGRNDVYEELQACIKLSKDDPEIMRTQVEEYRAQGLPPQSGLVETTMIFRDHRSETLKAFCEQWWDEVRDKSIRDQLSFNYVAWKRGFTAYRTFTIQTRTTRYARFRMHLKNYANSHQYHILMAGPFLGELSWELMAWQGIVRFHTKAYGFDHVQLICRPDHAFLYHDCADEIITLDKQGQREGPYCDGALYSLSITAQQSRKQQNKVYALTATEQLCTTAAIGQKNCMYTRLGHKDDSLAFDCLLQVPKQHHTDGETGGWSLSTWKTLCAQVGDTARIACIGSTDEHDVVEGTRDLRGISLERLADAFASSRMCIGPVSAYMHLAALCGCPRIVFDDGKSQGVGDLSLRRLCEHVWNPFRTRTVVLGDEGAFPEVKEVLTIVDMLMK